MPTDIQEKFGKDSAPRAYELKQANNTTQQNRVSISSYYTKVRLLWDEVDSMLPTALAVLVPTVLDTT